MTFSILLLTHAPYLGPERVLKQNDMLPVLSISQLATWDRYRHGSLVYLDSGKWDFVDLLRIHCGNCLYTVA